jgi:hypothetical protein
MACPRCGSTDIWNDNLWWGCNPCGYAAGPDGPTMIFAKDKPGLARSVQEMRGGNVRSTPPCPDPYLSSDEDFENW